MLAKDWLMFESAFSFDNYNKFSESHPSFKADLSNHRILFCAPHALNHFRHNNLKIADLYTGSLCQLLARETGQSSLVASKTSNDFMGLELNYIKKLNSAVEKGLFVVDLHGMSSRYGYDVCIGLGPNASSRVVDFKNHVVNSLNDYNISINFPFNASAKHTMTNYVQTKLSGDALQIEISSELRDPINQSEKSKKFIIDFTNCIKSYCLECL